MTRKKINNVWTDWYRMDNYGTKNLSELASLLGAWPTRNIYQSQSIESGESIEIQLGGYGLFGISNGGFNYGTNTALFALMNTGVEFVAGNDQTFVELSVVSFSTYTISVKNVVGVTTPILIYKI